MFKLFAPVLVALVINVAAINDSQRINGRTSNVHQYYSSYQDNKPTDPFVADVDYYGQQQNRQSDAADGSTNPSQQEWTGDSNPYVQSIDNKNDGSNYHYPQPMVRQPEGGSYGYQQYHPIQQKQYGYGPSKTKSKGKDKDLLWEIFEHLFGKKKELEDHIWDLILNKGQKGHGEPPSGYHQEDKGQSKVEIFKKVKFLAIAATVMLILLGSGIVLAPLVIGKGRRRSLFLPTNISLPSLTDIGQLATNVLRAIDRYQQFQQPGEGNL